jgi:hypothetical protein
MICRKFFFLAGLTLCVSVKSVCQVVTSAQNGFWNETSTWTGGVVPDPDNPSLVRILHRVEVSTDVKVTHLDVWDTLIVRAGGSLNFPPAADSASVTVMEDGAVLIEGMMTASDNIVFRTSPATLKFHNGSVFRYLGGSKGFIPIASWDPESTFEIRGFAGSGYIAIAYSDSWKQTFGNVVYNCPLQTSFVDLNGYLRNITGDFTIQNTNGQALRLSTTQRPLITVGRNFRVEGNSEVWVTTTSDSARLHVAGNFEYRSTSTGPSYFTTRGRCHVSIEGKFIADSNGPLRICSGSADSTGVRRTTIVLRDGLQVTRGSFIAPSPGRGIFVFAGDREQRVDVHPASFTGAVDFIVRSGATVDVGESVVRNSSGDFFLYGHLRLGSDHPLGALQVEDGGNIQTRGLRYYAPGSAITYNGFSGQYIGAGHPASGEVDLRISNTSGVTLLNAVSARNTEIQEGALRLGGHRLQCTGDVTAGMSGTFTGDGELFLSGDEIQNVELPGAMIRDLIISKNGSATVRLNAPLQITGSLLITSANTVLQTNGHLTLVSSGDMRGATASVGPLPAGASITGNVTVQRMISGEGRMYRYLSSPVSDATVADMKDDFPVTGTFLDPSTGRGINPASPSLFFYDPSLAEGWTAFPVSGYAAENILVAGRGYAAFIRNGTSDVNWDVTGTLNQGDVPMPVSYIAHGGAHEGWNLVGNPYASAIRWSAPDGWVRSPGIAHTFAIRDNAMGVFRYSDGEVGDVQDGLISASQAFWVHASAPDPVLTVREAAKAGADAEYYRSAPGTLHYLRIGLRGNGNEDNTWFRFDKEYDGARTPSKMLNDRLSVGIEADARWHAIHTVSAVSCRELVSIRMHFSGTTDGTLPAGSYHLAVEPHGLFDRTRITLVDRFLQDTVLINGEHMFEVNEARGSGAGDRFALIVGSSELRKPALAYGALTCSDTVALISYRDGFNARDAVSLYAGGDFYYAGADDTFRIPASVFRPGADTPVLVVGENLCSVQFLDTLMIWREPDIAPLAVNVRPACGPGPVVFEVTGGEDGLTYRWYDRTDSVPAAVTRDRRFVTPVRHKTGTWYLVAERSTGCTTAPVSVIAVVNHVPRLILWHDQGVLFTNAPASWYFNDTWVGDNMTTLEAAIPGTYRAVVELGGCLAEAALVVDSDVQIDVFPVPFSDEVNIRAKDGSMLHSVSVWSVGGVRHFQQDIHATSCVLALGALPAGIYVIELRTAAKTLMARIVKH